MSGFTRCLTAGIAIKMLRQLPGIDTNSPKELNTAITAAILAARRMLESGFDAFGTLSRKDTDLPRELRYPGAEIARILRSIIAFEQNPDGIVAARSVWRSLKPELEKLDLASMTKENVLSRLKGVLQGHSEVERLIAYVDDIYDDWQKLNQDEQSTTSDWRSKAAQVLINRIGRLVNPDDEAIKAQHTLCVQSIGDFAIAPKWSILGHVLPAGGDGTESAKKILQKAQEIVEFGDAGVLWPFPTARIGKLFLTSREEIESLISVRDLMLDYVRSTTANPLSIAVFGKPGSGKSFAINELARELPDDVLKVESRTFNLSQFSGPETIASALQQVRDIGLSGRMPLVFWDEFDTSYSNVPLGWLRYFLAPMQDGIFQDESSLRYVGRAIFVFAGGKYETMNELIEKNRLSGKSDFKPSAKDRKVPDFISRLKGFIDVPTLNYGTEMDYGRRRAVIDGSTALRRAKLLRGFLEREGKLEETVAMPGGNGVEPTIRKRLNIDRAVIAAFLRIPEFKFGARSIEAIVKMSALADKDRYDRSMLPPPDQLQLHVESDQFSQIIRGRMPILV